MSETRAVTLETAVDTTGARAGFQEITREAGAMAQAVARVSEQAETAVTGIGSGAPAAARNVDASQRSLINSIQRTTAAMEAGGRTSSAYYEALGRQRGVDPAALAPYLAQLRAVEQAQSRANTVVAGAAQPLRQVGVSAAQTAAALRQVPAQFTDIVTQLQGGGSPLTVLFQQGGQLRDAFGSAGGAARALGGYVVGLVSPFMVAAGAAGALAYAYNEGSKEAQAYSRAIILTGNAAGVTAGALGDMAKKIGTGLTPQSQAAAALTALVTAGKVSAENLEEFGRVALSINREVGKSVDDIAKEFAELGKAPLQASVKLNEQYHYLTSATYEHIKALESQGKMEEAGEVAQKAYASAFAERTRQLKDNLGTFESAWRNAGDAAKKAWDQFLNIGRPKSIEDQIAEIDAQLARAAKKEAPIVSMARLGFSESKPGVDVEALKQQKAALTLQKAKEDWDAQQKAIAIQMSEALQEWDKDGDKFLTRIQQRDNEIKRMREKGLAASVSDKDMNDREAKIRQSYADLDNSDIAKLEANRTKQKEVLAGQMQDLESNRKLQLVNATQFYAQKRDIDLKLLDLDLPILKATTAKDKKKEDQSDYIKDLAELQAYYTRRRNIIKGADNAIEEEANGPVKALKAQVAAWDRSIDAQEEYARQEMKLFGQTDAARSILIAQLRIEADARKQLDDIKKDRAPTEAEISNINRAAEAAKQRMSDAIGRTNAITGASRLRDENRRYALDDITDARRLSNAILEIDAEKWRDIISNTKEGSDERKLIESQFNEWYANRQGEADPYKRLQRSLVQYAREASDTGGQIGDALTNAFRSAEDAFASFATTGKLNFRDLATSIIADFARIQARSAIGGFAKSLLGSMGTDTTSGWGSTLLKSLAGARADGGPVNSGLSYLVGERGPEIFTPSSSGSITPNHLIGAGGAQPLSISFSTVINSNGATGQTSGSAGADARGGVDALRGAFKQWLAQEMRQGGAIWKIQQGRA